MKTIIEQACEALQAALTPVSLAALGVAGVTVYRNRGEPVPSSAWPALDQIDADGDTAPPDQANFGIDLYTVPVELVLYVGTTPAAPMTSAALAPAADALLGAAIKAALVDPTLGGLAVDTRLGPVQRAIDRDAGTVQAQVCVTLEVEIATAQGDPFTLPH